MNLKTFRAPSMAQALSEVKKDLGKDAVILHTRSYRVGAVLGMGGKQIIEITAADQVSARGPSIKPNRTSAAEFIPGTFPKLGQNGTAVADRPADRLGEPEREAPVPTIVSKPAKVEDLAPRRTPPQDVTPEAQSPVPPSRPAPQRHGSSSSPTTGDRRLASVGTRVHQKTCGAGPAVLPPDRGERYAHGSHGRLDGGHA